MRHAKSAWPLGVSDDLRPLNARGVRDATAAAVVLGVHTPIDLALVSPAKRTAETAALAFAGALASVERESVPNLYAASWWDILDVIRAASSDIHRLVVIGHNPGIGDLVSELVGPQSDQRAVRRVRTKYPTCAISVLSADEPWSKWGTGCASLTSFHTPKDGEITRRDAEGS